MFVAREILREHIIEMEVLMNNNQNLNKNNSLSKVFWGLLLILGAAALILDKLGYWPLYDISIFSLILTLCFIAMLVKGILHMNFTEILFALAFLAILYDDQLGIEKLTPWTVLFSALLGSIGLSLIFPHKKPLWNNYADCGEKVFNEADGEVVRFSNSFNAATKYINTDAFVNGDFNVKFGEMKIYFDNAVIKDGIANVNLDVSFGSILLFVPMTWNVENHIHCSFGDVKHQNTNNSPGCPTLRLYGNVSFGDVKIIYI